MKHCSRWVVAGFGLLVLAAAGWGGGEFYARNFLSNTPEWVGTAFFLFSPRAEALVRVWLLSLAVLVLASFISVVGLLIGPRTRACLLAGLAAPLALSLVFGMPTILSALQYVKRAL